MAKPSIFSRDYERKMKRRRRKIFLTILAIIVIGLGVFVKIEFQNLDFSKMRGKIQAWVDSGRIEDKNKKVTEKSTDKKAKVSDKTEQKKEPQKTYIDLNIGSGVTIKAEYSEANGIKKFVAMDVDSIPSGFSYSINPSGTAILVTDTNQNLIMFDTSGAAKNITKTSYTSQAGDVFSKDAILQSNPSYVWTSQARFIDDTRIAYVSKLPYFGDAATNSYVWIYDTVSAREICLYNYCAEQVTLGDIVAEKGLTLNVNGATYYVNGDGTVTQ